MNKFWVITKEVYKKTVKSFGFIALVASPILMVLVIFGIGWFIGREAIDDDTAIAVVSEEAFVQDIFQEDSLPFSIQEDLSTEEEAENALVNGDIDGYLTVDFDEDTIQATLTHEGDLSQQEPIFAEILSSVQTSMRSQALGISESEVADLVEPVALTQNVVSIEDGELTSEDLSNTFIAQGSAYAVCIAIFMFIMTYASIIAEEVANEKGTRIMEVILSSATPTQHFFGKLAGVMLILLTQVVLYVVIGVAGYFAVRNQSFVQEMLAGIDLGDLLSELMGISFIFFVVGVLMYVVLAAFLGSLVTKIEDVNKSVQPIIWTSLIGFYIGISAFASPDNSVAVVGSYIPLFTPLVMPFRVAAETVEPLGLWLSIIGTIAFAGLITFISLSFYKSNVLVYSDTGFIGSIKRSWTVMQSNRKSK